MENLELMQKEIESKRKLPKEVKDTIKTQVFYNFLVAIIIVIYLCIVNILFYQLTETAFESDMKIFALGMILVTVGMFEMAYRKESSKICIIGIELFICSIISLYIPYIYLHTNITFRQVVMALPVGLVLYYIVKAMIIYKEKKFQYQNHLSDVKEMMQYTEETGYLDEDSKKTYREKRKQEAKRQEAIERGKVYQKFDKTKHKKKSTKV